MAPATVSLTSYLNASTRVVTGIGSSASGIGDRGEVSAMTVLCRASLNYVPAGGALRQGRRPTEVEVFDGRVADLPGWQQCGFELVGHTSAVTDWDDDTQISGVHYAEMEELARKMTGCDHALVSGHIRRNPDQANRHQQLSPITFVHSDFAEGHADIIRGSYRDPREGARETLARNGLTTEVVEDAPRIVILQFWRNVGPAKMDYPLAFCDARTVSRDHAKAFHVSNYAGTGANFDALGVMAPDNPSEHRWYAFPELEPHEVVAFRTYDTDLVEAGLTYFTPHSAFRDPEVPTGQPARSSIEMRATCLFL